MRLAICLSLNIPQDNIPPAAFCRLRANHALAALDNPVAVGVRSLKTNHERRYPVTRASRQSQRAAERQFPVCIRIAVPLGGFGRQLLMMHAWLDETCGPTGWASALSGTSGGVNEAIAFSFESAAFAHAFVARFCCGYRIETIAGSFAIRNDEPPPRQTAAIHKTP
jgi:hypothetical protein